MGVWKSWLLITLNLTPTYLQSKLTSNLDDYGKKGCITRKSAGAGFIGDPVNRFHLASPSCSTSKGGRESIVIGIRNKIQFTRRSARFPWFFR